MVPTTEQATSGHTSDYDGGNPFEERKKEQQASSEAAQKESETLSNAEKMEKDKIFFRSIFVGIIKSPNILRKYLIGRPEFNTLAAISVEEPIVCQASDEFYVNFMPSLKGMLGPFQFIFEIFEKYEGLICLSGMIFMGCSMELDAWEKMEAEQKEKQSDTEETDIDEGPVVEGEAREVDNDT